jgi:hypothetical protein
VLPPVTATRWDIVEQAPGHLDVRAERWTVDDLDVLDSLGLAADSDPDSTTGRVLEHLVRRTLAADPRTGHG